MAKSFGKILSLVLIFSLMSCEKVKKEKEVTFNSLSAVPMSAKQEQDTKNLFESMENQTLGLLYDFGVAVYTPNAMLNSSTTNYKIALNMGLAVTGAVSCIKNKDEKRFLEFAQHILDYGERLGVSESILKKYNSITASVNKGDWDKVEILLFELKADIFEQLTEEDLNDEAILVMVSGWYEGVYVVAKSLETNHNKEASKILSKKEFGVYLVKNINRLSSNIRNKKEVTILSDMMPKISELINKDEKYAYTPEDIQLVIQITDRVRSTIMN